MKSKALILFATLVMALALMAQTATQTTPVPNADTKACACCNHEKDDAKTTCCGKGATCCGKDSTCCKSGSCCEGKDAKACPMMAKDASGKMTCCGDGKCAMMSGKDAKGCCGGKMCARPKTGT